MKGEITEIEEQREAKEVFNNIITPDTDDVNKDKQRQLFIKKAEDEDTKLFGYQLPNGKYLGTYSITIDEGLENIDNYIVGYSDIPNPSRYISVENPVFGFVSSAYVLRKYRGQGIGSKLHKRVEDYAETRCDVLLCEIWAHTEGGDGRQLMNKFGFNRVHSSKYHWKSALKEDVKCNMCGYNCDCVGEIWFKNI